MIRRLASASTRRRGQTVGVRLELWKWKGQLVPQIGPLCQTVLDAQTPAYDVYLAIMSNRFGTPTETHGSGTDQEFRDAVGRWGKAGRRGFSSTSTTRLRSPQSPPTSSRQLHLC